MSATVAPATASPRGDRALALLAVAISLASLAMVIVAVLIAATTGAMDQVFGPSITTAASIAVVGGLIASRRPREVIGWLLLFVAVTQGLVEFAGAYAHLAYKVGVPLPAGDVASWLGTWMWMPGLGTMVTFGFLLFPDGRLPSPRWRVVALVAGADIALLVLVVAIGSWSYRGPGLMGPGGLPPGSLAERVFGPGLLVMGACVLGSFGSLVARYRRADTALRHQLKWFVFGAAILVVVAGSSFSSVSDPIDKSPLAVAFRVGQTVGAAGLPVAIAIAIFRYRLYDIDMVISRTLVYGALAAFITAVYVGIVVGVGTLIGSGGQPNLALSIVATAIVAVAFQPVRQRLQKVANRLVYGRRATPYEVLSEFSERVAESYAADDVLPRMARVLAEGTGAEAATVWLRSGRELRAAAAHPVAANGQAALAVDGQLLPHIPDADRAVPVRHQGELLGALAVRKRPGESLTPIEEKLLDDLAHQAGLVLKNVGLTADLQARLTDLRASRQRLVKAQDDERRKLERNLHDGAQQHLVALKVKLGLAEMFAERDLVRAKATVAELKVDADEALEALRDLARGIYPPLLAERGLVVAVGAQARKATLPVEVQAGAIGRYPQDLEAAVYFCILEALQNVQKYAEASRVVIHLSAGDGDLSFVVEDDGQGFDPQSTPRGNGLNNMVDRLEALGGALAIHRGSPGMVVNGTLPVLATAAPPPAAAAEAVLQ
jgi:signal transduction histidine kinase